MAATKPERLAEIYRRLRNLAPFRDGDSARLGLEEVMRAVEDELSGVRENPNAHKEPPDGRMYPPHEDYEAESNSPLIRTFRHNRHRTSFGINGSILIVGATGVIVLDLSAKTDDL